MKNMNISQMMKQVEGMQKRVAEIQSKFGEMEVSGVSGGGAVKVTVSGNGEMKKVSIDPSLLIPTEQEILEDLIVAAANNAKQNANTLVNEEMQKLGLPTDLLK